MRPAGTLFPRLAGSRILVTGASGFKGTWLCQWLSRMGAEVHGLGLAPDTTPSLFDRLELSSHIRWEIVDLRDPSAVRETVAKVKPDVVFHLAAQALVRRGYDAPAETMATNVMGTVHLLEALRAVGRPCGVVLVSSDKCYDNREWAYAYRETDPLGGKDPYSVSKACMELVANTWRRSYFPLERLADHGIAMATARAGNVIGPGDYAQDRLVPDCIRALVAGKPVILRNPHATRPWQHVLEPLSGYAMLAEHLHPASSQAWRLAASEAWNFGPNPADVRTVADVQASLETCWASGGDRAGTVVVEAPGRPEARQLRVASDKASAVLGWRPVWSFVDAIRWTASGYAQLHREAQWQAPWVVEEQLQAFEERARRRGLVWTQADPPLPPTHERVGRDTSTRPEVLR